MNTTSIFFNQSFDKKRLKAFLYWVLKTFGEKEALTVVEQLKTMGFYNATKAGLSIGLHDLKTPYKKKLLISHAQIAMRKTDQEFQGAEVTATERSQRIVDTWHRTSEDLRKQVVDYFSTYDQLNSVYMMALSGARGNFSQVRQLIGMRGLMADPQGQIISFPIRSNLREGLTLTEYFISCSGARKGLVDTALRTADTGYLTRRLVDISHHIVVKKVTCYTSRGIALKTLRTPQKTLLALRDRLVGRVLAENIYSSNKIELDSEQVHSEHSALHQNQVTSSQIESHAKRSFANQIQTKLHKGNPLTRFTKTTKQPEQNDQRGTQSGALLKLIARKNQEISPNLAFQISSVKENLLHGERETALSGTRESQNRGLTNLNIPQVLVRSPLTCTYTHEVCQLCYGWSMAQGSLVSLGEAVGVIAGQSIGEPGTQLTMRTFHTGGVFSGDLLQEIRAPHSGKILFPKALQGLLIRTSQGKIAFLIKVAGELLVDSSNLDSQVEKGPITKLPLAPSTILFVRQGETVKSHQILAELAITTEQGNQPIKSRQTLFSEIGGRIVQWKSMTSRVHRTKGVPERSSSKAQQGLSINGNRVMQKVRYPMPKQSVSGTGQSQNKVLVLTQPTATTKHNTKPGIQAHIGPVQSTHNSQHLVLNKSDFMNQDNTKTSLHKNEGVPRQSKALAQRAFGVQNEALYVRQPLYMQRLAERNGQHDQETWGRLNNLTLKKTALTKRNGLGSIEPPKALKLGLLGVIATRVGASEKTCTKPVFSNPTTTLLSTLKTAVTKNKSGNLAGSNKRNKVLLTEKDAKHLDTHMTRLHHLNTIAEEGDLVDENYTQM